MSNFISKFIIFLILSLFIFSSSNSNETDCNQFEKLSSKYLECNAKKLKEITGENIKTGQKNLNESKLIKKIKEFKESKTFSDLMEK